MRDQVILARNALKNDIPLFTLVGTDIGILLFLGKKGMQ